MLINEGLPTNLHPTTFINEGLPLICIQLHLSRKVFPSLIYFSFYHKELEKECEIGEPVHKSKR